MRKNIWPIRLGTKRSTSSFLWAVCSMIATPSWVHHVYCTLSDSYSVLHFNKWSEDWALVTCSYFSTVRSTWRHWASMYILCPFTLSATLKFLHCFDTIFLGGVTCFFHQQVQGHICWLTWQSNHSVFGAVPFRLQYELCNISYKNCFSTGKDIFSRETCKWFGF